MPRRVVIVGAGVAGVTAAENLRTHGFDGDLVLLDGEDEAPYNRPPLSKEYLTGELDEDDIRLLPASELDLDLRLGTWAQRLDVERRVLETSDGPIAFDHLVIGTGSAPVLPAGWREYAGVTALRTLDDARTIRAAARTSARVTVVGGGFVGCEVASSLRGLGAEVTLVEATHSLMSRVLDPRLGDPIARMHREAGVDVRCGVPVARLHGGARVEAVELADGTTIATDLVVVGLGTRPATGWLESSGFQIADGVHADATLRVAPGVHAVGDVVRHADGSAAGRRDEHWTSAREHGLQAAENILDPEGSRSADALPFVWSDQFGRRIQVVGSVAGEEVRFVDTGGPVDGGYLAVVGTAGRPTGVVGFDRPREFRRMRRLVESGADWAAVTDRRAS